MKMGEAHQRSFLTLDKYESKKLFYILYLAKFTTMTLRVMSKYIPPYFQALILLRFAFQTSL